MEEHSKSNSARVSFIALTWRNIRAWLVGCSAAVFFGIAILVMSMMAVTEPKAAGLLASKEDETIIVVTPTPTIKVEYYLPYPGILPDSPIYRLKALRDKWRLSTIFDPIQKAQYELLLADKRINAAVALIDGGQTSLGVTTISKAEKYLEQAAIRAVDASKSGKDSKSLLLSLSKASLKHEEIIQNMSPKVSGADSQVLEGILTTTRMVQQLVKQTLGE